MNNIWRREKCRTAGLDAALLKREKSLQCKLCEANIDAK